MNTENSDESDPEWDRPAEPTAHPQQDLGDVTGVSGRAQKGFLLAFIILGILFTASPDVGSIGFILAISASILLAGKIVAEAIDRIGR